MQWTPPRLVCFWSVPLVSEKVLAPLLTQMERSLLKSKILGKLREAPTQTVILALLIQPAPTKSGREFERSTGSGSEPENPKNSLFRESREVQLLHAPPPRARAATAAARTSKSPRPARVPALCSSSLTPFRPSRVRGGVASGSRCVERGAWSVLSVFPILILLPLLLLARPEHALLSPQAPRLDRAPPHCSASGIPVMMA
eukprot:COSAG01_NODE_1789_length_9228_cov_4.869989_4_plen_201_part_00